jgi:hypothetical protein
LKFRIHPLPPIDDCQRPVETLRVGRSRWPPSRRRPARICWAKDATAVQSRNEVLRLKAPTAPHFPPCAPQTAPLDVAGIPELNVRLTAPQIAAAQTSSPAGKLQLFAKLFDVAPNGSRTLVKNLVSAARVPDVTKPVGITRPGIVHRLDEGHSVQLVQSAADATYKGFGLGGPVVVADSPEAPNVLSLPVVARAAAPARPVAAPAPAQGGTGPGTAAPGSLPTTGPAALLPAVGGLLLAGALVARRRRTA